MCLMILNIDILKSYIRDLNNPVVLPTGLFFLNRLNQLIMWIEEKNRLQSTFQFKDFTQAFAFMTEVAIASEKQGHHPNWSNVWNRVDIQLTTHTAGNIVTEKDRLLATAIDAIFQRYNVK